MSVTALTPRDEPIPSSQGRRAASRIAALVEQGLVGRGPVNRASQREEHSGADKILPVREELRALLPWRGLRRGATVAVAADDGAPGSTSLLLALTAEASRHGAWCGVVGVAGLGALAAVESGVDLGRLALAPDPGAEWATVAAALLDGLDVVAVRPPGPVPAKLAQRLAARAKQRGSVLIPYGRWPTAEVALRVTGQTWHGLGAGRGRLRSRELAVASQGRGSATRPREARLWLPAGAAPEPLERVAPGVLTAPERVAPGAIVASERVVPALPEAGSPERAERAS